MSRLDAQFKLRLPEELKALIEEASKDSHRSMNAEIVARLEYSFQLSSSSNPHDQPADHVADAELEEDVQPGMLYVHDKDGVLKGYTLAEITESLKAALSVGGSPAGGPRARKKYGKK